MAPSRNWCVANTARQEEQRGDGLERGPGSPGGPCQGLVFILGVLSPTLSKSIKSCPYFSRSVELSPHFLIISFLWYLSLGMFPLWKSKDLDGDDKNFVGRLWGLNESRNGKRSAAGLAACELNHDSDFPSSLQCLFSPLCLPEFCPQILPPFLTSEHRARLWEVSQEQQTRGPWGWGAVLCLLVFVSRIFQPIFAASLVGPSACPEQRGCGEG